MSIFGMMRTATSGMAAQSNKLGTVSDNIANASTHGYKRAFTEFSSMTLESGGSSYVPGNVETDIRYGITQQGGFDYTTSTTDVGISGAGFLLVGDGSDATYLTRAGSFVTMPDGSMVNAAGYQLLGYPITNGNATVAANGTGGLEPVTISSNTTYPPSASTVATLTKVNLPALQEITGWDEVAGAQDPTVLPGANPVPPLTAQYAQKSSLTVVDSVGTLVNYDVYFSKTDTNKWQMTVYPANAAAPGGGFPYTTDGTTPATGTTVDIEFDPATNKILPPSPTEVDFFTLADGTGPTVKLDFSAMTQIDSPYEITAEVDGNAPSSFDHVEFGEDGTLSVVFENSERVALYRIPLATTAAPDNLNPVAGNAYTISADSGDLQLGFPGEGQFGNLKPSTLEKSTVDTATELTDMIEAQYSYTANSKVFQTAGELMEVLVNLKR
jgi:flagellar hook protein FlgE